ncbi:uncharacterized protein BCR38DRAFT_59134 [Pseudomassariella vexata]|uniref:Secreted protein n=1 Tax=Pseudomassariella vexata TaxID=1141098 RepID=A0A1Y2DJX9_9PEZI|nr:uncharacterized protein BCR38DRAFT_59134 [Pseudomassariella vexata]ORY59553.1 hypothetical protein BCR38DRAFT_59134 [Pseudomassariella vexata]
MALVFIFGLVLCSGAESDGTRWFAVQQVASMRPSTDVGGAAILRPVARGRIIICEVHPTLGGFVCTSVAVEACLMEPAQRRHFLLATRKCTWALNLGAGVSRSNLGANYWKLALAWPEA